MDSFVCSAVIDALTEVSVMNQLIHFMLDEWEGGIQKRAKIFWKDVMHGGYTILRRHVEMARRHAVLLWNRSGCAIKPWAKYFTDLQLSIMANCPKFAIWTRSHRLYMI